MTSLTARSGPRAFIGLLAALGLVAALTMPALAGAETTWAEVDGYAPGTALNNSAGEWAKEWGECEKLATPEGGWSDTYILPGLADGLVYSLVVVKAGSDQSTEEGANTLYEFPAAGETVWADAFADGAYGEGDKNISHIIICTDDEAEESQAEESQAEESQAEESQAEESVGGGVLGGNPTPTGAALPDTAAGQFGQIPATVLSLLLMSALAATIYVRLARQR